MRLQLLRGGIVGFSMILAIVTAWGADGGGTPVPRVTFVHPVIREISDYVDFTGRTVATARVEVQSRVTGTLLKANFKEGATVKEGDLLFEIDPRLYRDKMDSAEAAVAVAEARFDMAAAREKRLAKAREDNLKAVSNDDYSQVVLTATVAKAELRMAKAKLAAARFDVDSTRILAPFSGQIGQRLVDPGNLVIGDKTNLAVILSQDPLRVSFDIDENTFLKLRKAKQEGQIKGDKMTVGIGTANDPGFPLSGVVDFTDNEVHSETGTIRARAVLTNQDKLLLPGMFVRVRLTVSAPRKAVMIPENVIYLDGMTGSRSVYIINKQNLLQKRKIKLGVARDELREVIEGLSVEDRVVSSLFEEMTEGILVQPKQQPTPKPKDVPDSPKPDKSHSSLDRAVAGPVVRAIYPRANAKVIAESVAEPIEFVMQPGGLLYLRSRISYEHYLLSTNFARGTSLTEADKSVKNRLALILNLLPPLVIKNDVTVSPGMAGIQLFVNLLSSDDRHDNRYLSEYALLKVRDKLARVRGVGTVRLLGSGDYGLCVKLDKQKLRIHSLTPIDVKQALDAQPKAELKDVEKLGDLVVKTNDKGGGVCICAMSRSWKSEQPNREPTDFLMASRSCL